MKRIITPLILALSISAASAIELNTEALGNKLGGWHATSSRSSRRAGACVKK